jgi:hypothetical protein
MTDYKNNSVTCAVCGLPVPKGSGKAFISGQPSTGKVETWAHTCTGNCTEMVRYMLDYAGSLPPEEMYGLRPSEMVRAALRVFVVFR